MSFRIRAVMMSMPFDSWVTIHVCNTHTHRNWMCMLTMSLPASITHWWIHPLGCTSLWWISLPGSPDRGPGSTQWASPGSEWSGGHLIRWCRGPAGPGLRWCFHTWCPGTEESHTPSCSWSYCFGSAGSSGNTHIQSHSSPTLTFSTVLPLFVHLSVISLTKTKTKNINIRYKQYVSDMSDLWTKFIYKPTEWHSRFYISRYIMWISEF